MLLNYHVSNALIAHTIKPYYLAGVHIVTDYSENTARQQRTAQD